MLIYAKTLILNLGDLEIHAKSTHIKCVEKMICQEKLHYYVYTRIFSLVPLYTA